MLTHSREYTNGKYGLIIVPIGEGNLVKLDDIENDYNLKQYFTKDDETAFALFESVLDLINRMEDDKLLNYKCKDHISEQYYYHVNINKE